MLYLCQQHTFCYDHLKAAESRSVSLAASESFVRRGQLKLGLEGKGSCNMVSRAWELDSDL